MIGDLSKCLASIGYIDLVILKPTTLPLINFICLLIDRQEVCVDVEAESNVRVSAATA